MTTIFVNLNASGSNNGQSWNNAYTNLQTAIANAQSGDEIWVAKGTYRPTLETDRTVSFVLKNGVKMYGGFAGSETSTNQRDIKNNITELSGDLGTQGNNTDNSYHVVDISNTTSSSVLNGFTISNGNADLYSQRHGGGIYGYQSSAVLANLTITNNSAYYGGGIYLAEGQNQLNNISFIDNYASNNGGGLYNNSTSPIINNVTFGGNVAADDGGAIYNYYDSNPKINKANFINNVADEGGAIYNGYLSNPVVDRAIFKDNIATVAGGGIYNSDRDSLTVNSLFAGNISPYGGGIYNYSTNSKIINSTFVDNRGRFGAAITNKGSDTPSIINSIIWNNQSYSSNNSIVNIDSANTIISNSLVEDGYNGESIYTNNPQFVNPGNFDYRLSGDSIAIDVGSTNEESSDYNLDLAANPRIVGNAVDLGAYEGAEVAPVPTIPTIGQQKIIYVDSDATGEKSGSSWDNAYTDLRHAIASASFGTQIWVAEGTYKPSQSDRDISFKLKNGVAIYGGFAGNESSLNQRDLASNPTVLSGDIGTTQDSSDNSYHVVDASNTTNATILDGFTIKDGYADAYSNNNDNGGGIYAFGSQAIFSNLIVEDNYASDDGGGIYTSNGLNQFVNISFADNYAKDNGGGIYNDSTSIFSHTIFDNNTANNGGGVYNSGDLIVEGAAFVNNIARNNGGGITTAYSSSLNLTDTVFRYNQATYAGGAIYNYDTNSNSSIANGIFNANTSQYGGAIYNHSSNTIGTNLTFANNQAEYGAAVYSTGNSNDKPTYRNSVFWNNSGTVNTSPIVNDNANTVVRNSIVEAGYDGLEIIDLDPQFANSALGDFRLQPDSPAINAGLNEFAVKDSDLIGNDRIIDNKVDLGAYEYFAEQDLASHSGTIGNSDILVSDTVQTNSEDNLALTNVHRFYQNQRGFHFYSSDLNEIGYIKQQSDAGNLSYDYESEKYSVLASDSDILTGEIIEGVKPVYRFFNNETGAHLYTMDKNEKNYIQNNLASYDFENIKYYAFEVEPENYETVPVYRMRNSDTGTHLLTIDQNEVNTVQNYPNFSFEGNSGGVEGVAFHVFALDI